MAKFSIRRTFKFADLLRFDRTQPVLQDEAVKLSVQIENRALSGLDENNRVFAPYSARYQRAKKFGKGTVDLHGSSPSQMWSDFGVLGVTRTSFTLGFHADEMASRAFYHEAGAGRLPVRRFLGIPEDWMSRIRQRLLDTLIG